MAIVFATLQFSFCKVVGNRGSVCHTVGGSVDCLDHMEVGDTGQGFSQTILFLLILRIRVQEWNMELTPKSNIIIPAEDFLPILSTKVAHL